MHEAGRDPLAPLLRDLLGHNAGYAAAAALAVLAILVVGAFAQGRRIELRPYGLFGVVIGARGRRLARDPRLTGVRRVYEAGEASRFYAAIAARYDESNSIRLVDTHMEILDRIVQFRGDKPNLDVLDLGSGTGERVATYFLDDHDLRWTAVDSCAAMVEQFRMHLAGRPLAARAAAYNADLNHVHVLLAGRSYDLVLLNLVLSSMPELPNFRRVGELIAPGGWLIISDINPEYTRAHPYYKATAADGSEVALRPKPIDVPKLAARTREAGLHPVELAPVGSTDPSYSFIAIFAGAARLTAQPAAPTAQHFAQWTRLRSRLRSRLRR
jgi:SAM-dependent methyltransferase